MSFDLIICDIDGCLGPEDNGLPLDSGALDRLRRHNTRAQMLGDVPALSLCSGRPLPFVEALARLLDCHHPCVAENGVWLWQPGSLPEADPRIDATARQALRDFRDWLEHASLQAGFHIQPGKCLSASVQPKSLETLDALADRIRSECEAKGWPLRISRTWEWINCDLDFVSKGSALRRLKAATGLPRTALGAIGDTPGDLAMQAEVGWFGCPANAHETVKAASDHCADAKEVAGIHELLALPELQRPG